jgi:regulator of sirC expression with transglutaminase-like and TPR domain
MRAQSGLVRGVEDGGRAVADLIAGQLGYDGDRLDYDNPRNADLISVIDRRRGLPVALGILYLHAARAAGMQAIGLNTQSHFVLRLSLGGEQMITDPFNGGAAVNPAHVPVELRPDDAGLAQLVSDTDVLLRLQNNLKLRALSAGDHARGLELTRRMVLIAPRRSDLWFDLARLNEALGVLGAARRAFETCLALAPPGEALHNEAAISLSQLKRRLN